MQKHNSRIILNCDGASRGNPGHAAAGGTVKDESGNVIAEYSEYLGIATNNVAEYKALIIGLEKLCSLKIRGDVLVLSDSELMVKQLNGYYRIKEPSLQLLAQEVCRYKKCFNSLRIEHVPRVKNKEADALANKSLDGREKEDINLFDYKL